MFGLDFLFVWAFWALPLAGLPVLLHMLFRRKSPVIHFSTLRFIKASIQQTAARRRIQRWILLACRILLLALLIGAVAQPVRILASGWLDAGGSMVAAIVIDTSYSMQLKQQELPLLDKANDIVPELLRQPLKNAKVAIFRSLPPPKDQPEHLEPAAKLLSEWTALTPQPAPKPLGDRVASAIAFLNRQQANQKWLVVLSDLQSREFPTPLPALDEGRTVLFDLHPEKPASHGISGLVMEPEQPIPGIGSRAVLEVTGQAGDAPFANLKITRLDGTELKTLGNLQARFETTGRTKVRAELKEGLPVERWLLVTGQLQRDDDLPWDNARSQLIELPPRQTVTFIDAPTQPAASNFVRLALDPWEGKVSAWPLEVRRGKDLSGQEQVAFVPLTDWPDAARTNRWLSFVRGGGTLVLLLQPGLEQAWQGLSAGQKSALAALLPGTLAPTLAGGGSAGATGIYRPVAPARADRVLEGLTDPSFRLNLLSVRRFVPFAAPGDPAVSTLLYLSPASGDGRTTSFGLLYRRTVGNGAVFTLATLPEGRYISPPTHPVFLPLLVGMALRPPEQREAQNVELGQALSLGGGRYAGGRELEIQGPAGERYRVAQGSDQRFVFEKTLAPGLYYWRKVNDPALVGVGNVQYPSAESDLLYKPADAVVRPGPECLVVRSFAELEGSMARLNQPEPHWTGPLAIVLVLICLEALLASMSDLWKPLSLRWLWPKTGQ